jgi:APA family basic amino acid/polyamine antiporter
MEVKRKYGLFTAISMIVGIVIGSGIFFKSHSVLQNTGGNVGLGVLVFFIAAISIIFGSLTLAELALRTTKKGGVIAYAEEALGRKGAVVFGWFQNFVYFPSVLAILAWALGIYISMLMDWDLTLEMQMLIGIIVIIFFAILNFFSAKLAGYFQNLSTLIKLVPIFVIGIAGIFFSNPNLSLLTNFSTIATDTSWLAAIPPVAFIYDGWSIATNISHEIKDEKRNLPLALIISPLFILAVYLMYFVGLSFLVGPETIVATGSEHVNIAMGSLFGSLGSKILLTIIVISIMGTANGMILAVSRSIYVLGSHEMIPYAEPISRISPRFNTPTIASIITFVTIMFWCVIHYFTTKHELLKGSDVSEISVVTIYLLYTVLYLYVIRLRMQGKIESNVKGYVIPCLAIIGSCIMLYGGMQNPMFLVYASFSFVVIVIAYIYASMTDKKLSK